MEIRLLRRKNAPRNDVFKGGFTLIEIIVVVGVSVILITAVTGIMTSSFRVKTSGEAQEKVQNQFQVVAGELKKNIFEADGATISCPMGVGDSISFDTVNGGHTNLWCDLTGNKIASISAQSGAFDLTSGGIKVFGCDNFVSCQRNAAQTVTSIDFNINIGVTDNQGVGQTWNFVSKVVPR